MTGLTDWTLIRSFLGVMRGGSLSAAARATHLTQPTLGRHISELEIALNLSLFTRSPTGLIPTEAALLLLPAAEAMESALASLVRTADAGGGALNPRGTVRITASEAMGFAVLPAILAGIRDKHPQISFELVLNNRTDNLLRRDADLAVRMAKPTQDYLFVRELGTETMGLYSHRSYLDRFGTPANLEELFKAHLIGFDRDDHPARALTLGGLPISRDLFAVRCDQDAVQMEAIKAGLGIGVIQKGIARRLVDLVPVLAEEVSFPVEIWLAVHEDQRHQPAIRATFDGLAEGLKGYLEHTDRP